MSSRRAAGGRTARAGGHDRAGARDRRLRPGRRPAGRLAGNASVDVAAGRTGRAGRGASRWPCSSPPTTRSTPTSSTIPTRCSGPSVEAAVLDPENPYVLGPHLAAAAAELPLTEADATYFGPSMVPCSTVSTASGVLRRRPTGWFWAEGDRPTDRVSLRGSGPRCASPTTARAGSSGRSTTPARTPRSIPARFTSIRATRSSSSSLDLDEGCALVRVGDPGWSTQARSVSAFDIVAVDRSRQWGPSGVTSATSRSGRR